MATDSQDQRRNMEKTMANWRLLVLSSHPLLCKNVGSSSLDLIFHSTFVWATRGSWLAISNLRPNSNIPFSKRPSLNALQMYQLERPSHTQVFSHYLPPSCASLQFELDIICPVLFNLSCQTESSLKTVRSWNVKQRLLISVPVFSAYLPPLTFFHLICLYSGTKTTAV